MLAKPCLHGSAARDSIVDTSLSLFNIASSSFTSAAASSPLPHLRYVQEAPGYFAPKVRAEQAEKHLGHHLHLFRKLLHGFLAQATLRISVTPGISLWSSLQVPFAEALITLKP